MSLCKSTPGGEAKRGLWLSRIFLFSCSRGTPVVHRSDPRCQSNDFPRDPGLRGGRWRHAACAVCSCCRVSGPFCPNGFRLGCSTVLEALPNRAVPSLWCRLLGVPSGAPGGDLRELRVAGRYLYSLGRRGSALQCNGALGLAEAAVASPVNNPSSHVGPQSYHLDTTCRPLRCLSSLKTSRPVAMFLNPDRAPIEPCRSTGTKVYPHPAPAHSGPRACQQAGRNSSAELPAGQDATH